GTGTDEQAQLAGAGPAAEVGQHRRRVGARQPLVFRHAVTPFAEKSPLSGWQAGAPRSTAASTAVAEAVAEGIIQLGVVVDLADGGVDVVLDAAERDGVAAEENVAGTPVAVARLADRPDVDQRFPVVEAVDIVELLGRAVRVVALRGLLGEDARDVDVAVE